MLIWLWVFSAPVPYWGQTLSRADSLRQAWVTAPDDSSRFALATACIRAYFPISLDSSRVFLARARTLAGDQPARQASLAIFEGNLQDQTGLYHDALASYQAALRLASSSGDSLTSCRAYTSLGANAYYRMEFAEALIWLDSAQGWLPHGASRSAQQARIAERKGLVYMKTGDAAQSMAYFQQAMNHYQAAENPQGMASTANNIGLIYLQQDQDSVALSHFRTLLALAQAQEMTGYLAIANTNMGVAYGKLGMDSLSAHHFEAALAVQRKLGHRDEEARLLNNLAVGHQQREDYLGSNALLTQARAVLDSEQSPRSLYLLYINFARNYLEMDQLALARRYADSAAQVLASVDALQARVTLSHLQYRIAEAQGDHQTALNRYQDFRSWQDSLNGAATREQTSLMEQRFALERQALENTHLRTQQAEQTVQLRQQRLIIFLSLGALLLTIGLLLYSYRMQRYRQRTVHQLRAQAVALEAAKAEAEAATRAKADFLSVMSHEIRTPLNAVIAIGHLLLDGDPRPDQRERLLTLRHSARQLLSLINDILDFSKIEAGKLALEQVNFDLKELAHQTVESFRPLATEKELDLQLDFAPALASWWQGDPVRIGQVLTNLVGNAIKFTPSGQVCLRLAPTSEGKIRIEVSDTGVGIDEAQQAHIFEAFTQSGSDTARRFGGSGLGLSICRRLLLLMDSDIQLQSVPGQGSTFYFTLALPVGEAVTRPNGATFAPGGEACILVVEDNLINQMVITQFLEKWHFRVLTADDGETALDIVQREAVDLVLMDIHMPGLDGLETTRRLRALPDPHLAQLPVIAFSASSGPDGKRTALAAGMNDSLSKPFDPDQLLAKLRAYLKQYAR